MNNKRHLPYVILFALFYAASAHAEAFPDCMALDVRVQTELLNIHKELQDASELAAFKASIANRYDDVENLLTDIDTCKRQSKVDLEVIDPLNKMLNMLSSDARALMINKYERWIETRQNELALLEKENNPGKKVTDNPKTE